MKTHPISKLDRPRFAKADLRGEFSNAGWLQHTTDFLVIGGGMIRSVDSRDPAPASDAGVCVLEKEPGMRLARQRAEQRGHPAGFYYCADSLKAKFTRAGNIALTAYCEEKKIPLNRCGKLVVARDAEECTTR